MPDDDRHPHRDALARLRCGELDVEGYIDERIREAMAHLSGLPERDRRFIETSLRERIADDPRFASLLEAVKREKTK